MYIDIWDICLYVYKHMSHTAFDPLHELCHIIFIWDICLYAYRLMEHMGHTYIHEGICPMPPLTLSMTSAILSPFGTYMYIWDIYIHVGICPIPHLTLSMSSAIFPFALEARTIRKCLDGLVPRIRQRCVCVFARARVCVWLFFSLSPFLGLSLCLSL